MKIRSPWISRIAAVVLVCLLRMLYSSCRVIAIEDVPNTTPYQKPDKERYLYCIWHDILLMAIFSGRPHKMAGLVSRHQDGGYLADAMKLVGITPVRGSSHRGGMQALKQCLDAAKEYHVSITPDGPRGPRHQAKEGIVYMSSMTGRQIVPIAASCKRYWRIQGNWTDMLVPKPFTKILIKAGAPISIPPDQTREQIAAHITALEQRMAELTEEVERAMHPEKFPAAENTNAAEIQAEQKQAA